MGPIDPVTVLSYGATGLGFLLALFSYGLLRAEQKAQHAAQPGYQPDPGTRRQIYGFMIFSVALCVIGLVSQYMATLPGEAAKLETAKAELRVAQVERDNFKGSADGLERAWKSFAPELRLFYVGEERSEFGTQRLGCHTDAKKAAEDMCAGVGKVLKAFVPFGYRKGGQCSWMQYAIACAPEKLVP